MSEGQGRRDLDPDPRPEPAADAALNVGPAVPSAEPEFDPPLEPMPAAARETGPLLETETDPDILALRAVDARPGRSPLEAVCPFLRAADGDTFTPPGSRPDARHRCLALAAPLTPGLLQQELLCLDSAHPDCPRYRQGLAAARTDLGLGAAGSRASASVRVAAALVAVVAVLVLAAFFLSGGLRLPVSSSPTPSLVAAASASPTSTPSPTPSPTFASTPSPSPTPTSPPSPTPSPSAPPTASPTRTPTASTSDPRYAGLARCPAPQTCYIYIAKSYSTVYSIAAYFHTTVATIDRLNPQIDPRTQGIHSGEPVKIPPPQG